MTCRSSIMHSRFLLGEEQPAALKLLKDASRQAEEAELSSRAMGQLEHGRAASFGAPFFDFRGRMCGEGSKTQISGASREGRSSPVRRKARRRTGSAADAGFACALR